MAATTNRKKTTKARKPAGKTSRVIASKKKFSFSPGQRLAVYTVAVLALVGVGYLLYNASRNYLAQATAFQYVGTHPQASTETTERAKNMETLAAWNGKIYAGYGDWDANTGPMSVTPFDPATGKFAATPEYVASTEAVEIFKVLNDKLYAVHVDPRGSANPAYSVASNATGVPVWTDAIGKLGLTHTYGLTQGNSASEMFISGQLDEGSATNEVAKVFRTTDGGATWTESLSAPSRGGYNRMMFIGKLGTKIYAQRLSTADFNSTDPQSQAWVFDGSRWASATPIRAYMPYRAEEFAGTIVTQSTNRGGALLSYDGRTTTAVRSNLMDYTIGADGYLYALNYEYKSEGVAMLVARTKDLVTWENITYAPWGSQSIAYLNNVLYVGTNDSKLYRAEINPNIIDSTPPSVTLNAPATGTTITASPRTLISANAADAAGISRVEFYVGEFRVGTSYSIASAIGHAKDAGAWPDSYYNLWDGSGVPAGTHQLKAIAYDSYGNSRATPSVTVIVPEGLTPPDATAPTVTITAPQANAKGIRKSVSISATATDNVGLAYMEILVDGRTVATQTSTSGSLSAFNVPVSKGSHTIVVVAKDKAGNTSQATRTFSSR